MEKYKMEEIIKFSNNIKEIREELLSLTAEAGKFFNKTDFRDLQRSLKKLEKFRNEADSLQYDLLNNINENQESLESNYNIKNLFYGDKAEI